MSNRWMMGAVLPIALLVLAPSVTPAQEPEIDAATQDAAMAQEADGPVPPSVNVIYEREVFRYQGAGRPDPFRSLLLDGNLGVRVEDLSLRGVVYHPDPSRSVAVLAQRGSTERIQARVGERVGTLRILSIQPERVEVVVEELGVSRRETLTIERPEPGATQ